MIAHEHPCVNTPTRPSSGFSQRPEKAAPVIIILKNRLPAVPPRHDVVERSGMLNADAAGHDPAP